MSDLQKNDEALPQLSKNASPEDILEGHFTDPEQAKTALIASHSSFFSGPLPPPEILIRYNDATPDAADRILKMAEKQAEYRHRRDEKIIQSHMQYF